jgi:hypothetical protein
MDDFNRRDLIKRTLPSVSLLFLSGGQSATAQVARTRIFAGRVAEIEEELTSTLREEDVKTFLRDELRPFWVALPSGIASTVLTRTIIPSVTLSGEDEEFIRQRLELALPDLLASGPPGLPPGRETIDNILAESLRSVRDTLASSDFDPSIGLANQASDFFAAVVGDALIAVDKLGLGLIVIAPATKIGATLALDSDGEETASLSDYLLLLSLSVECLGLLLGVAGLSLPKVDLAKVVKDLLPLLKTPAARRAFRDLAEVLSRTNATVGAKADGILQFLKTLSDLGVLSRLVSAILSEASWTEYLIIGLRLTAFIASFFLTAGTATAARITVVLATSLYEIAQKVHNIVTSPTLRLSACDTNSSGTIDRSDVEAVFASRGYTAGPGDPRDPDLDALVTPNDARICATRCTNLACGI